MIPHELPGIASCHDCIVVILAVLHKRDELMQAAGRLPSTGCSTALLFSPSTLQYGAITAQIHTYAALSFFCLI